MIETGIARQLDAVGRITLPKELRKSLGFKDRELLEIYTEDDKIILRKCERQKQDIFTGSEEDLIEYKWKIVSKNQPANYQSLLVNLIIYPFSVARSFPRLPGRLFLCICDLAAPSYDKKRNGNAALTCFIKITTTVNQNSASI